MFLNVPENLNEKQKKSFEQAWLSMLQMIVNAIKLFIFLVFFFLVFAFFGDSIFSIFTSEKSPTPEEIEAQRKPSAVAVVDEFDKIENGIHVMTGMKVAEGWEITRGVCTACHSAKMVIQTKATRDGWKQMIRWMQETQGLWDLGAQEKIILDYLAANYAPEASGRRPNIKVDAIEWFELDVNNFEANW